MLLALLLHTALAQPADNGEVAPEADCTVIIDGGLTTCPEPDVTGSTPMGDHAGSVETADEEDPPEAEERKDGWIWRAWSAFYIGVSDGFIWAAGLVVDAELGHDKNLANGAIFVLLAYLGQAVGVGLGLLMLLRFVPQSPRAQRLLVNLAALAARHLPPSEREKEARTKARTAEAAADRLRNLKKTEEAKVSLLEERVAELRTQNAAIRTQQTAEHNRFTQEMSQREAQHSAQMGLLQEQNDALREALVPILQGALNQAALMESVYGAEPDWQALGALRRQADDASAAEVSGA